MTISLSVVKKTIGAICIFLLAGCCGVGIYDYVSPWPTASKSLKQFSPHIRLCVGINSDSTTEYTFFRTVHTSTEQRVFILMRTPISWPRMVSVSENEKGQVAVEEASGGFWFWVVIMAGLIWGSWHLGIKPFWKGSSAETE